MKDAQDTYNQRTFSWWNYSHYLFCRTADLSKLFCFSFFDGIWELKKIMCQHMHVCTH